MSDTFDKLPAPVGPDLASAPSEDRDGNGLTEFVSTRWKIWCSDAMTAFCNGVFSGAGTGGAVGTGNAIRTADGTSQTFTLAALAGFALAAGAHGVKHFVVWHAANPMPNPRRP